MTRVVRRHLRYNPVVREVVTIVILVTFVAALLVIAHHTGGAR